MNTPRAPRFQPERESKTRSETDELDDLGAEPLAGSGFENEDPERDFEERS